MIQPRLTPQEWLRLSHPVRLRLAEIFKLHRSQGAFVQDNVIKSDGFTHNDLLNITVPTMQAFLLDTTEDDFFRLFNRIVDLLEDELEDVDLKRAQEQRALCESWINTIKRIKEEAARNNLSKECNEIITNLFVTGSVKEEHLDEKTTKTKGRKAGRKKTA